MEEDEVTLWELLNSAIDYLEHRNDVHSALFELKHAKELLVYTINEAAALHFAMKKKDLDLEEARKKLMEIYYSLLGGE